MVDQAGADQAVNRLFRKKTAPDQRVLNEQLDVTVKVHQGANLVFLDRNRKGFFALYDTDIETYDSGEPEPGEQNQLPSQIATLTLYEGRETLTLVCDSLLEKRNFITTLIQFLESRRENT